MADNPESARRPGTVWFAAWVAVGFVLMAQTMYLSDLYFARWWTELTFLPVNPSPGYATQRLVAEVIPDLPWVPFAYALAGVWVFRGRGCLAVACALVIGCCPCLFHTACGLGRL